MVTEKSQKSTSVFTCSVCDYTCFNKYDYNKHILTRKHLRNTTNTQGNSENSKNDKYTCPNCDKLYLSRKGLWCHKKKCIKTQTNMNESSLDELEELNEDIQKITNQNELILFLLKENKEFKQMLLEQNKQTMELNKQVMELAKDAKTTINNNTTNNNKFKMNIFLNEKCKDALNIMDFVTSLSLNMEDLEETGKQGYVKGLSRILVNGLKGIDISKRPIHCSDLKRETLYIKDNNVWEKEDAEKKRIKNAIKYISLKNAKQITQWTKENEGYRDSHNKKSDVYLKLVYEANGGDEEELNKIIKNISASVIIDKNV